MLPSSVRYGFVTGRILLAIADRTTDSDRLPDGVTPPAGKVTFTPIVRQSVEQPSALVIRDTVTCGIDAGGYLTDPAGGRGVWLIAGQYRVQITTTAAQIPELRVEVTSAHTEAAPLDIVQYITPDGAPAPVPQWQYLTLEQYTALPAHDPGTLYLIGDPV